MDWFINKSGIRVTLEIELSLIGSGGEGWFTSNLDFLCRAGMFLSLAQGEGSYTLQLRFPPGVHRKPKAWRKCPPTPPFLSTRRPRQPGCPAPPFPLAPEAGFGVLLSWEVWVIKWKADLNWKEEEKLKFNLMNILALGVWNKHVDQSCVYFTQLNICTGSKQQTLKVEGQCTVFNTGYAPAWSCILVPRWGITWNNSVPEGMGNWFIQYI